MTGGIGHREARRSRDPGVPHRLYQRANRAVTEPRELGRWMTEGAARDGVGPNVDMAVDNESHSFAASPPSITRTAPVRNDDNGEASRHASGPISSGAATRP